MSYVKLFGSILESTVWETSPETRCVWIAMLAMSDQDGIVSASVPGLARRAGVERTAAETALALFLAPAPDTRPTLFEGRRIEEVDGGWRLLNHAKYRSMDSIEERRKKTAERVRRWRERNPSKELCNECNSGNPIRCRSKSRFKSKSRTDPDLRAGSMFSPDGTSLWETDPRTPRSRHDPVPGGLR